MRCKAYTHTQSLLQLTNIILDNQYLNILPNNIG